MISESHLQRLQDEELGLEISLRQTPRLALGPEHIALSAFSPFSPMQRCRQRGLCDLDRKAELPRQLLCSRDGFAVVFTALFVC
jgi:hypothetical protein